MPRIQLFRIGDTTYGLDAESIRELVDHPQIYRIPGTGTFLLGAINLHGQVLPVIDLPALLGIDGRPPGQQLVVLSPQFHNLALAVSAVGRTDGYDNEALNLPTAGKRSEVVAGIVEVTELPERVNLLDAGAIVERLQTIYTAQE
jgi:purine-binding chemotaxis protein CheW